MPLTPEEQVQFLRKVQRLLGEGLFLTTYKYALLMGLADLSVQIGNDSGGSLDIDAEKIAEKFIECYRRQTLPFLCSVVLRQYAGKPPVVVTLLLQIRSKYGDSLASAKRDSIAWILALRI